MRPAYKAYKPSGVEWLGDIPAHWEVKRTKYTVSINDEILLETTNPEYEILYVDISSVDPVQGIIKKEPLIFENAPSRARRIVKNGDTIISTVRTYLKAISSIVNPEPNLIVSTGFAVLRPKKIYMTYLSYLTRTDFFINKVVSMSVGVSYPAINASDLGDIKIPIPPVAEQEAIAAFLDRETGRIDGLIAKKQRLLELLKEKRAALISRAVTKGLNPAAPMKPSGVDWLGEVPTHWKIVKLKSIGKSVIGLTYSPEDVIDEESNCNKYLVLRSSNIQDNKISFDDKVYVSAQIADKLLIRKFDILICSRNGSRNLVGKSALITESYSNTTFGAFTTVFRSKYNKFIFYFMSSEQYKYQSTGFLTTTINQLTNENLNNIIVTFPPVCEQEAIANYLNAETAKIDRLSATVQTAVEKLREYRSSLIGAAVTGKIDVTRLSRPQPPPF